MFKILVVEDDSNKLRFVSKLLESLEGINSHDIHHEVDSVSAKQRMKSTHYDVLIVDIAIPTRKSEPVDIDGGVKLVKEILTRDIYNIPSHIVGLTALDTVFAEAVNEFKDQVISVIRYSDTDDEWESNLKNGISQWLNSKRKLSTQKDEYNYDVAIITAVDIEFDAVKSLSSSWSRVNHPSDATHYLETYLEVKNGQKVKVVAACASQMGMTASAVLSMKLIYNFRPRYIFMPGIAATLKDSSTHGFGDVIMIDESWDGGAGKITENENGDRIFQPVAYHLRCDRDLAEKIRAIREDSVLLREIKDKFKLGRVPNTELSIHIGSAVSVAGVIENKEVTRELIAKDRKLIGLEMESYGMYYSANNCSNPKPKAMALKSVSDFASISKSDFYQAYAAYTSCQIMHHLVVNECDFE